MASIFKKNITNLISGIIFLAFAFYRLYQYLTSGTEAASGPIRLVIALVFFGYGIYAIYTYFKKLKEEQA